MTEVTEMTEEERALLQELEAEEAARLAQGADVDAVQVQLESSDQVTLFQTNTQIRDAVPRIALPTGEVRGGVHRRLPGETVITKGISLR